MYQTDLTEAQKSYINRTIPIAKRKRKFNIFVVLDAIFYIVKTGCQWRMLPSEFPKWQLVYYYFRRWSALDEFDYILKIFVEQTRLYKGQSPVPSLALVDSQSVKSALPASEKGIDGNKKVKGIKRHVATDKNGYILSAQVTTANVHDSKAAYALLVALSLEYPWIKKALADSAYRGELGRLVKDYLGMDFEVVNSHFTGKGFVPIKKRWVVERTFAWLDNFRRLTRNYEESPQSARNMLIVAAIILMLKHLPNINFHF